MGFLSDSFDKVKGAYKKAFSLYKTDEGKLGLQLGCDLVTSGACTAGLAVKGALDAKKAAKAQAKAEAKAAKKAAALAQLQAGDAPEVEEHSTLRVVTVSVAALLAVALLALTLRPKGKGR